MALDYRIASRMDINPCDIERMHRLRAQVFRTRLKWSVPVTAGQEADQYDTDAARYMLMYDAAEEICGCWRILPTTANYMLADTFQSLLHGAPAPRDLRVFELSRFAVDTQGARGFGFSHAARGAIEEIVRWSMRNGVGELVTVTTLAIERLLVHMGLDLHRYGPPCRADSGTAVALRISISARTVGAALGNYQRMA